MVALVALVALVPALTSGCNDDSVFHFQGLTVSMGAPGVPVAELLPRNLGCECKH